MTLTGEWFGDRAVLVVLEGGVSRDAVLQALKGDLPGASVRAGLRSVLVQTGQPDPTLLGVVETVLAAIGPKGPSPAADPRTVTIPVEYGGPDLADVARVLGCRPAEVVAAHSAQSWTVAMMGFAPGFAYLLPAAPSVLEWDAVPRRARPRERVPAGSVAVAAGMSAVYPVGMPGGWQVIGQTGRRLFDPADEDTPSLLRAGDRVRFEEAGA
jgi:5-oxoprolinase (ATP-hydrolysing) subunit B